MVENDWNKEKEADKYGLYATPEERRKIDIDKVEENENVQLNSPQFYEHHHQQFLDEVDKQADILEKQMQEIESEKAEKDYKSPFKTVDHQELYEGINLQTKYHTDEFNERVEEYEKQIDNEMKDADEVVAESNSERVLAQGMTPVHMPNKKEVEIHHPNPSINLSEMYGTMNKEDNSFVQVSFEHEHDNDDIVPELTENVVIEQKKKTEDARKTDFAGEKYTEIYDD